ncbi:uncharacterized protein EV422DRAFT_507100 [Fimicolochytrium jonesii]|uniref:uncharacterized protein n=1 Tax=Fimicolochytrium jonesii TaxID=1396493 RepID=UPI0022FF13E9|nr:uncharacterized protein EV422DRAFT_507100 [Fimicolochytrium jonesii]KAI8819920.1 hypothetical protein EV422DRAFT_507100 [Fimicolochytrium jonesii]
MVQKGKSKRAGKAKHPGARRTNSSSSDLGLPAVDDDITTSTTEAEDANAPKRCPHLKADVRITRLSKQLPATLKKAPFCSSCRKDEQRAKSKEAAEAASTEPNSNTEALKDAASATADTTSGPSLWLCLKCGAVNCSRNDKGHGVTHYEDEKHSIAINLDSLECWCYQCDDYIVGSSTRNQLVSECKAMVEGVLMKKTKKDLAPTAPSVTVEKKKTKGNTTAPGIVNLGNTCFFNSVMQCINVSQSLQTQLKQLDNGTQARIATDALGRFLADMAAQRHYGGGSVNPRELFGVLSNQWKMYKRMGQQDSHELLRRLLDRVREETADRSVEARFRYVNTPVDKAFAGKLCQVIVCDTCKHVSYAFEDYLDFSLPVKDEVKEGWKFSSLFGHRSSKPLTPPPALTPPEPVVEGGEDGTASEGNHDPDQLSLIQILLRPIGVTTSSENLTLQSRLASFMAVEMLEGESVYACDSCFTRKYGVTPAEHAKEVHAWELQHSPARTLQIDTASASSSMANLSLPTPQFLDSASSSEFGFKANALSPLFADSHEDSSATSADEDSATVGDVTDAETASGAATPRFVPHKVRDDDDEELPTDSSGNTIERTNESAEPTERSSIDSDKPSVDAEGDGVPAESMPADNSSSSSKPASEEASLDPTSSLPPSPAKNGAVNGSGSDTRSQSTKPTRPLVESRAYKRYLIHTSPQILVLHLKRFQQIGFGGRTKKVEDVVAFDEIMDLAPFMAPPEVETAVMEAQSPETEVDAADEESAKRSRGRGSRYRLYGVVVHGGGLFSGHYVAYVRISKRPPPANGAGEAGASAEEGAETKAPASATPEQETTESEWAYCSDTHTRAATWEEVSKVQAYILFYERWDGDGQ